MEEAALSIRISSSASSTPTWISTAASSCVRWRIPTEMFTAISPSVGMAGWIANFKEILDDPKGRIYRPRQVYVGSTLTSYVPMDARGSEQAPLESSI